MRIPVVVLLAAAVLILGASAQSTPTGSPATGGHVDRPLVVPSTFTLGTGSGGFWVCRQVADCRRVAAAAAR